MLHSSVITSSELVSTKFLLESNLLASSSSPLVETVNFDSNRMLNYYLLVFINWTKLYNSIKLTHSGILKKNIF